MEEHMSVSEAAAALGLSERAVRNRIERGDIQAERIGARVWVIPKTEIDRWKAFGKLKPWQARRLREADDSTGGG